MLLEPGRVASGGEDIDVPPEATESAACDRWRWWLLPISSVGMEKGLQLCLGCCRFGAMLDDLKGELAAEEVDSTVPGTTYKPLLTNK